MSVILFLILRIKLHTAAILRLMQGSATVAIGAGASIASHVNDSGFWLVNRYLGLTVPKTFRTWTVATTLLLLIGFVMTMLIGLFVT